MPSLEVAEFWVGARWGQDYVGRPAPSLVEALRIAAGYHARGHTAIRIRSHVLMCSWCYRVGDERLPEISFDARGHRWKGDER